MNIERKNVVAELAGGAFAAANYWSMSSIKSFEESVVDYSVEDVLKLIHTTFVESNEIVAAVDGFGLGIAGTSHVPVHVRVHGVKVAIRV